MAKYEYRDLKELKLLEKNPRKISKEQMDILVKSIQDNQDYFEARPIILSNRTGELVIIAGNQRYKAAKKIGLKQVPTFVLSGLTEEKEKEIIIRDNVSNGDWDMESLVTDAYWNTCPFDDWGLDVEWNLPADELERREKELKERMAAGEISEEDEEYQEFLEKYKLKKTTDDCYTPDIVYDAVADWVAKEYNLKRADFVRPFYPGGDYQSERYRETDIVVDNPPFSILAEIIKFYISKGIRFFLFGPHLTLFSGAAQNCTTIPVGVVVTYENGATVNTSFVTNLEDKSIRVKSSPSLYQAVKEADDKNKKMKRMTLPKYTYDKHIIMAPNIANFSKYGIDFVIPVAESEVVSACDSQKEKGKGIFGCGYFISDRLCELRERAERAERERAERERERRERSMGIK
jgi:hypothetical protein